jgi:hypothetical protein
MISTSRAGNPKNASLNTPEERLLTTQRSRPIIGVEGLLKLRAVVTTLQAARSAAHEGDAPCLDPPPVFPPALRSPGDPALGSVARPQPSLPAEAAQSTARASARGGRRPRHNQKGVRR